MKITLRGKLFPSASAEINNNLIPLLQNIGAVTVNAPLFNIYSKDDPENVKEEKHSFKDFAINKTPYLSK